MKLSYKVKKAPRGSHCGGVEDVAYATRRRRRMSLATFFLVKEYIEERVVEIGTYIVESNATVRQTAYVIFQYER